jgi:hypothetical protein
MGHVHDQTWDKHYQDPTLKINFEGIFFRGRQGDDVDFDSVNRVERGARPPTKLPVDIIHNIKAKTVHLPSDQRILQGKSTRSRRGAAT